jgi:diaminohydroxyphosphoribosylaminopyrimidine deaminase / 5-amino-6-(5-phosphoribosylamino)uracil reductase
MTAADIDLTHMARALQLAERGLYTTDPNPRVGCVLTKNGHVIAEGWHERAGQAHAEAAALAVAGTDAAGATAYVTLEPCSHVGRTPPCADALIAAGIRRVVAAVQDPNPLVAGQGFARLRAAGIAVETGLLEREARALNPGFFSRHERGRPLVRLKLAMSLDGRTALADGRSQWITGEAARADVQRWRARSSAILTGAGTARTDDPRLNVRWQYGPWIRQPLRVLLDARLTVPASARLFAQGPALVFSAPQAAPPSHYPAEVRAVPSREGELSLPAVLAELGARGLNEVWVECGPRLAGGWLSSHLVDELVLYVAPSLLGPDARPLARLAPLAGIADAPRFEYADVRKIGEDVRLILQPKRA